MLKRGINVEVLNFVIGLIAGITLGVAAFALTILAWAMKLSQGGN